MLIDLDYIHTKFREACQILELKQPILKFEHWGNYSSHYNDLSNEIIINVTDLGDLKICVLPFIKLKLEKDIGIIMFILYHELAHCLQWTKFEKWFINHTEECREFETNIRKAGIVIGTKDYQKYRELKLEKCADKIAYILFEKLERKREEK